MWNYWRLVWRLCTCQVYVIKHVNKYYIRLMIFIHRKDNFISSFKSSRDLIGARIWVDCLQTIKDKIKLGLGYNYYNFIKVSKIKDGSCIAVSRCITYWTMNNTKISAVRHNPAKIYGAVNAGVRPKSAAAKLTELREKQRKERMEREKVWNLVLSFIIIQDPLLDCIWNFFFEVLLIPHDVVWLI